MTIPIGTNYPTSIDTNQQLFQVHDALRVRLIEDYAPGDTSISVLGTDVIFRQFDTTGIITLTEQCSEPDLRAISFYYSSITIPTTDDLNTPIIATFNGLELLSGFTDVSKLKDITDVTQNVMSLHHNNLKDALIAIEHMAGKKGEEPNGPLEGTMEQRISYLRDIVLAPKAWFSANHTLGLAPFAVTFKNESFRLGTDGTSVSVESKWDFGDNTGPSIITIEETTEVPSNITDVLVVDTDGGEIIKTYTSPGIYDVTLTVTNDFGTDSVTFPGLITARFPAPGLATIEFIQRAGQVVTSGTPSGGPYPDNPPSIRSVINELIDVYIPSGLNINTGDTNSGEVVDESNTPVDPVVSYSWKFSDDLEHNNSSTAHALFSVGGYYDLVLRTDTEFGAYRFTIYDNAFDIVENINLWLWTYDTGTNVAATEFGLISETFKTKSTNLLTLDQDDSFLDGAANEDQQKAEFLRNNGFAPRGSSNSGGGGVGLLYWASGRGALDPVTDEEIVMSEYNGFLDTYTDRPSISRPWNWIGFPTTSSIYFFLGGITSAIAADTSPTNQVLDKFDLAALTDSQTTFTNSNYKNGADELKTNEVTFDGDGNPEQGHMSVYRSCWKDDVGYFLRNEGVGTFFRLRTFYKTSGNTSEPFVDIRKLPSMAGSAKVEGQLVAMSQGVYFFCNSGTVTAYSPTSGIWAVGGPGVNSSAFRLLQDTSVSGFDDASQTLLAASDGDKTTYLSFDYSVNAFIKFNEIDTTFSGVTARPSGTQWQMAIY